VELKVHHDLNVIRDSFGCSEKFIQFVTILHIFLHGKPMLEYESLRELFLLLKVKNTPLKHRLDNSHW
jgi:hypothetical protein